MKNDSVPQEKISALADGELDPGELEAVLTGLRQPEGRKEWDVYHQIGDVLRSEDMDVKMSPDFAARLAAKLDAEPVIFAPAAASFKKTGAAAERTVKRYAVSGIAAVVAAFAAYLLTPQFMNGSNTVPAEGLTSSTLASASAQAVASASSLPAASTVESTSTDAEQDAVVLRDPNIDEYLIAHQRYSPSLYDTTQFVRSATFESEPKK